MIRRGKQQTGYVRIVLFLMSCGFCTKIAKLSDKRKGEIVHKLKIPAGRNFPVVKT